MENQDTDSHATEREQLVIPIESLEEQVTKSSIATTLNEMIIEFPPSSPECCIFKAPKRYREFDGEREYHPLLVSIGPFHHGKEELKSMENLKAAYLYAFLNRCSDDNSLETCIAMIKKSEQRIRDCYAENIEFSSDDFVKMILLDSCFLIEIIWRYNYVDYTEKVSDQLSHPRIAVAALDDIILLENQLPFFVLQALFDLAIFKDSLIHLCIQHLGAHLLSGDCELAKGNISNQKQIKHLLDLLRMCQAPSIPRHNPKDFTEENSMWNATQLEEAGMVIKRGPNHRSAADICYTKGVLEIPKLMLNTSSEPVLRNLTVLESCLYNHDSYISDYIHFMDNLIDTSKDVELLIRNGVVQSFSSDSHEVATLFNNLRPRLLLRNYLYHGIEEKVDAYCKVPRNKWRATLRRDYCSSPWLIASTIAAIILLILTFIQAVCSIISVS